MSDTKRSRDSRTKGTHVDRESGVSVIVGTLLLILITVTAAAGLAIMVSELQKSEMERQSYQASVKSEELIINGIEPYYNNTTLERLKITVLNMNTEDSRILSLGMNNGTDMFPKNFSSQGRSYNNTEARLVIPAARQELIEVNFTTNFTGDPMIQSRDALRIRVITSYYNTFERTFKAPTAEFTFTIDKEDLGATERDIVRLDGSASVDDGSIVDWNWAVEDGSKMIFQNNWTDAMNITRQNVQPGKSTSFLPPSSGPFRINLTVTDDSGMKNTADYKIIPKNARFFPAAYLDPFTRVNGLSNTTEIVATVRDLDYQPVQGVAVMFVKVQDVYGNLTLDRWSGLTGASGQFSANITQGTGTIRVSSGKIPPVDVPVSSGV